MRKLYFITLLPIMLWSNGIVAQTDYCYLSDETIEWMKEGQYHYEKRTDSRGQVYNADYKFLNLLIAAEYYNKALNNNPFCELILKEMAAACIDMAANYTELNLLTSYRADLLRDMGINYSVNSLIQAALSYLEKAEKYSSDPAALAIEIAPHYSKIRDLMEIKKEEVRLKKKQQDIAETKRKDLEKKALDYATFFQTEIGYGSSYGVAGGVRLSVYAAPTGYLFTAGLGLGHTLYSAGAGYSFGNYAFNVQLIAQWGYHKFIDSEEHQHTMQVAFRTNIRLFGAFGITADVGGWGLVEGYGEEGRGEWDFSVGLFYRF